MPAKSARKVLADKGEQWVDILQVYVIAPNLVALSFRNENHERVDDLYNASDEHVKLLLAEAAGKDAKALIAPDSSEDDDGHPEVKDVKVEEEQ